MASNESRHRPAIWLPGRRRGSRRVRRPTAGRRRIFHTHRRACRTGRVSQRTVVYLVGRFVPHRPYVVGPRVSRCSPRRRPLDGGKAAHERKSGGDYHGGPNTNLDAPDDPGTWHVRPYWPSETSSRPRIAKRSDTIGTAEEWTELNRFFAS